VGKGTRAFIFRWEGLSRGYVKGQEELNEGNIIRKKEIV